MLRAQKPDGPGGWSTSSRDEQTLKQELNCVPVIKSPLAVVADGNRCR